MKTIKIEGVIVIFNGRDLEYMLPHGFGGMELRDFVDRHKERLDKFKMQCTK